MLETHTIKLSYKPEENFSLEIPLEKLSIEKNHSPHQYGYSKILRNGIEIPLEGWIVDYTPGKKCIFSIYFIPDFEELLPVEIMREFSKLPEAIVHGLELLGTRIGVPYVYKRNDLKFLETSKPT